MTTESLIDIFRKLLNGALARRQSEATEVNRRICYAQADCWEQALEIAEKHSIMGDAAIRKDAECSDLARTTSPDTLNRCPFCGGAAEEYGSMLEGYGVQCKECGCSTPQYNDGSYRDTRKRNQPRAIATWNKRVSGSEMLGDNKHLVEVQIPRALALIEKLYPLPENEENEEADCLYSALTDARDALRQKRESSKSLYALRDAKALLEYLQPLIKAAGVPPMARKIGVMSGIGTAGAHKIKNILPYL